MSYARQCRTIEMLRDGVVGVRTMHIAHALLSACFHLVILHSNFTYIDILGNTFTYICVFFFQFLGACDQHTTKWYLQMGISPGDKGVTTSLFNPTCSLLPPLSLTKLELFSTNHFLY